MSGMSIYMQKVVSSSGNCVELIRHFEELKQNAYLCPANVPTIGYGTTIYPGGERVKLRDTCTPEEALDFLRNDLVYFERVVETYTREDISQQQFDALTSFCYHVGPQNLKNSTLLKIVNNDPSDLAEIEKQWLKWSKSNGKTLKGLMMRRAAEFYLYRFGTLQFN